MVKVDLSGLQQLAYRGFDTQEQQEAKDELIEMGYTLTESEEEYVFAAPPEIAKTADVNKALDAAKRFWDAVQAVRKGNQPPEYNYSLSDRWTGEAFTEAVQYAYKTAEAEELIKDIHLKIKLNAADQETIESAEVEYVSCKPPEETHKRLAELKKYLRDIEVANAEQDIQ